MTAICCRFARWRPTKNYEEAQRAGDGAKTAAAKKTLDDIRAQIAAKAANAAAAAPPAK